MYLDAFIPLLCSLFVLSILSFFSLLLLCLFWKLIDIFSPLVPFFLVLVFLVLVLY